MSNIKRYLCEWEAASVVVEIDHDVMTDEKLSEINRFWSGDQIRLRAAKGNITTAVLRMLTATALTESFSRVCVVRVFNEEGIEGWPPMDGSYGIKIVSINEVTIDELDVSVREMEVSDA